MSDEIDRDRLVKATTAVLVHVMRLPEWMQVPALGRDMRPLAELTVDAVLPLFRQARYDGAQTAAKAIENHRDAVLWEPMHEKLRPIRQHLDVAARLAREAVSLPVGDGATDDTTAIREVHDL